MPARKTLILCTFTALLAACDDDSGSPDAGDGVGDGQSADGDTDGSGDGRGDGDADGSGDGGSADGDAGPAGGPDAGDGDAGSVSGCDPSAAPEVGELALSPVVSGLSSLVYAAQPEGSQDWYLVEQTGRIRVFSGGSLRGTAFLDLSSLVDLGSYDERGLLGLAFPEDYAESGRFYVTITPTEGAGTNHDLVLEYQRKSDDPYVADTSSRKVILDLGASDTNHNGGHISFGPDGMLYVGTGDGGGGCNSDKPGTPQDVSSALGKILRLDPSGSAPYAAAGNPFPGEGDGLVLHYGLRNPFRFGFDRATGDLYVGDVGQNSYEEIDVALSGQEGLNFGWAAYEANAMTCGGRSLRAGSTHTPPIFEADRRENGCSGGYCDYRSIIGGTVYRGSALPQLRGAYVFGDYYGRLMNALYHCDGETSPVTEINKRCDVNEPEQACFTSTGGAPALNELTAIVEDGAGELYLVANRTSLLKLVPRP